MTSAIRISRLANGGRKPLGCGAIDPATSRLTPAVRLGVGFIFLLALAASSLPLSAFGQGDAPPAAAAPAAKAPEVDEAPYAPRKLKFREVEERAKVELKNLGPKVLTEQWYLATVRVDVAFEGDFHGENRNWVASPYGVTRMIELTKEDLRPSKELLDLLQIRSSGLSLAGSSGVLAEAKGALLHLRHEWKPKGDLNELHRGITWNSRLDSGSRLRSLDMRQIRPNRDATRRLPLYRPEPRVLQGLGFIRSRHELYFLAPTAELAKGLAEAFLTIYDQGFALPSRRSAAPWRQSVELKSAAHVEALVKAREQLAAATKSWEALQSVEVLSSESAAELKRRQLTLRIEQVGVNTRLAALEKKLAEYERRRPGSAPETLVSLKESTEIDAAGLSGQLNEIERLFRLVKDKQDAQRLVREAEEALTKAQDEVELDKLELAIYEADYNATAPYELADEAIPVQPIAWTTPTPK